MDECKIGIGIKDNGTIGIACLTHRPEFRKGWPKDECAGAIREERKRISQKLGLPEFKPTEEERKAHRRYLFQLRLGMYVCILLWGIGFILLALKR